MIDKSGANLAGLQAVNVILKFTGNGRTIMVRQVKYLNNILEQDHRFIKRITRPMMGFKAFHSAAATLAGIETAHMIRKGQIAANGATAFQTFAEFEAASDAILSPIDVPFALSYFGGAGKSHMEKYGTTLNDFAEVRAKASRHAAKNPLAVFRDEVTAEEVMWPGVLHRLMACPPTCGAAAAVLVSAEFARRRGLGAKVAITAQEMVTDRASTFDSGDMMRVVGYDMAAEAAGKVYESAGIGPGEVDVVELHDCFAQNELISYEALGLCPEGGAQRFIADGDNTYGGKVVTNPSGGLLSKGHPLGATGLAQCFELTRQVRGTAGATQVEGARVALQHNLGVGGACVVTMYQAV